VPVRCCVPPELLGRLRLPDKFDLVHGGAVLDPSQSLKAKRDIGIRWGTIEAIEAEIPPERALKTID
jgi:dihydroorotase